VAVETRPPPAFGKENLQRRLEPAPVLLCGIGVGSLLSGEPAAQAKQGGICMRRHLWIVLAVLLVGLVALSACSGGAPKVDWELKVTGAVSQPLTLSFDDLAGRDLDKLDKVLMERSEGDPNEDSWEGVMLATLLGEAGAAADASAIVFRAADEYEREVPMADVGEAIVAIKQNGGWLTEDEKAGPIRIVIPGLPGSRWVGQLVEIEVLQ